MLLKTLPNILFLDIETVSVERSFKELDAEMKSLWSHKASYWMRDKNDPEIEKLADSLYTEKAGIYAEFGKIVCISLGILVVENNDITSLRINSIYGDDEAALLQKFSIMLTRHFPNANRHFICGHNIKEFDVPYIARRLLINKLAIPNIINVSGKKPWELKHLLDTLEMWKFGDYKNYTSLRLLAHILGIPSPKDDIDGSQVGRVYWEENDLERIRIYCEKDVKTVTNVYLALNGFEQIDDDRVVLIN